ncbi:hypothetical protein FF100_22175 [Methylobacterium terricola]|uniref:Uncharacterized protein n=1 Tax=Methylobacterium terricola TaxID=2583531 RepID=A0A5C4LDP4_9HYPH|nr:hypothetical protein [Methylobacterium terricola]TNC10861.1 hypothetical protein FF100_22175 [Methylobacterium terricola]
MTKAERKADNEWFNRTTTTDIMVSQGAHIGEVVYPYNRIQTIHQPGCEGSDFVLNRDNGSTWVEPLGSVLEWCIFNNIEVDQHPTMSIFRMTPQTDNAKFLVKMRWY